MFADLIKEKPARKLPVRLSLRQRAAADKIVAAMLADEFSIGKVAEESGETKQFITDVLQTMARAGIVNRPKWTLKVADDSQEPDQSQPASAQTDSRPPLPEPF